MVSKFEKHAIGKVIDYAQEQKGTLITRIAAVVNNKFWPKLGPEDKAQVLITHWMRWKYPLIIWFHPENESKRSPFERFMVKNNGLLPGMPDILVLRRSYYTNKTYNGLGLELKILPNKLSDHQASVLHRMQSGGYLALCVSEKTTEELFFSAIKTLEDYCEKSMEKLKNVSQIFDVRERNMDPQFIIDIVCDFLGIGQELMRSKVRVRHVVFCRQMCMVFIYKMTVLTSTQTGQLCGDKDHATVLHAVRTIDNLRDTDRRIRGQVAAITKLLTE